MCKNENAVVALREIAAGKVRIREKGKQIIDESQKDNE